MQEVESNGDFQGELSQELVGERIKGVRKRASLTQEEFADTLKVTRGAVGNWETGKGIKTANLRSIAWTFGYDVALFFDETVSLEQAANARKTLVAPSYEARASVINWLEGAMTYSQMNQSQVGHAIGLEPNKISRMTNGSRQMSAAEMLAISLATGYPVEAALDCAVKPHRQNDPPLSMGDGGVDSTRYQASPIKLAKHLTGLTGEKLAEKLDISAAHLSRMGNDKRRITTDLISKLATVSGISTEEFYRFLGTAGGAKEGRVAAKVDDVSRYIEEAFGVCERLGLTPTVETISSFVRSFQSAR